MSVELMNESLFTPDKWCLINNLPIAGEQYLFNVTTVSRDKSSSPNTDQQVTGHNNIVIDFILILLSYESVLMFSMVYRSFVKSLRICFLLVLRVCS